MKTIKFNSTKKKWELVDIVLAQEEQAPLTRYFLIKKAQPEIIKMLQKDPNAKRVAIEYNEKYGRDFSTRIVRKMAHEAKIELTVDTRAKGKKHFTPVQEAEILAMLEGERGLVLVAAHILLSYGIKISKVALHKKAKKAKIEIGPYYRVPLADLNNEQSSHIVTMIKQGLAYPRLVKAFRDAHGFAVSDAVVLEIGQASLAAIVPSRPKNDVPSDALASDAKPA